MRCVEETTSLEQIYDETLAQMRNGNHYMLLQLLDDVEFFLRILEQEESEVLVTFFDVAIHDGRNIKMMIESESIAKFKAAAKNPNHEVIDVLLKKAKEIGIDIKEALKGNYYSGEYVAFHYAAKNSNHKVMEILLNLPQEMGINIKEVFESEGYTIFRNVVENTNDEVIKLLFDSLKKAGIKIEEAFKSGNYISLHYAAQNPNHKVLERLLKHVKEAGINIRPLA